ncbi:MAG: sulfite exporter TauE/SafE family protein [Actinomycetota bacterium]
MTRPGLPALALVGVLAGLFSGILGVGGGIVMVPLMVGVLGFDQHRAHATSLAAIVLIAVSGALRFGVAGELEWAVGLALGFGGVVGSTLGAHLMHRLSPTALRVVFGVIMILAGARMVMGSDPGLGEQPAALPGALIGVGIGLVAGIASGVAGIGGGVIMVPAMVFLLGLPQHAAEGTSLLAILFTALAGTRVNLRHDRVELREAVIIGAAGVLFAQAGASLALAMSGRLLSQVFGVFVALVGIRMVVSVYRTQRRARTGGDPR